MKEKQITRNGRKFTGNLCTDCRLVVETPVKVYPPTERFWYYSKRPLVQQFYINLKEVNTYQKINFPFNYLCIYNVRYTQCIEARFCVLCVASVLYFWQPVLLLHEIIIFIRKLKNVQKANARPIGWICYSYLTTEIARFELQNKWIRLTSRSMETYCLWSQPYFYLLFHKLFLGWEWDGTFVKHGGYTE